MAWRSMTGAIESDAIKENEIRRAERQSAHAFGLGLKRGYEKCGGLRHPDVRGKRMISM